MDNRQIDTLQNGTLNLAILRVNSTIQLSV